MMIAPLFGVQIWRRHKLIQDTREIGNGERGGKGGQIKAINCDVLLNCRNILGHQSPI